MGAEGLGVSCREFVGLFLGEWLAGDLPPRRRRDCERHVRSCSACAEYAEGYREIVRLTGLAAGREHPLRADPDDLPEDLVQEILRDAGS